MAHLYNFKCACGAGLRMKTQLEKSISELAAMITDRRWRVLPGADEHKKPLVQCPTCHSKEQNTPSTVH